MACLRRPAVYVLSNVKGLANELRSRLKDVQIEDISTTSEGGYCSICIFNRRKIQVLVV